MPKVLSYTPPWLCRPSPGAALFSSSAAKGANREQQNGGREGDYVGPVKTLARRGNEVFVVVDNQIRWSNLTRLKDEWKQGKASEKNPQASQAASEGKVHYRVLNVPVYSQIRQILPSPNGSFLAIITDHTVHISVIPDSSHLSGTDNSPIRVKTYQLGPTTHVIPEAPVVSAVWHPLGLYSNLSACIVTITTDAAVRVWELDRNNQWSFDRPTLAIDLKKLVDGTSSDQDFAPSGFGKNKGFSADMIDMEVASACFGGTGSDGENAWAPMTLWVAMKPGDLYALCPLLPSKWQAPSTTVPALSSAIVPKLSALEQDPEELEEELTACRQQYEWLKEIDSQEPLFAPANHETLSGADIFVRPAIPSAIPRMQGPFRFDTGDEIDDLDLCDLLVVPAKADLDDLMLGEEEELALDQSSEDKLSATLICLSTGTGRVHICLELDGVEGQWLPKAKINAFRTPLSEPSDLVLVESLDTVKQGFQQPSSWPMFSRDVHSQYGFFVTSTSGVSFISLSSWVQRLEAELQSEDTSGSAFRLQVLCEGSTSSSERVLQVSDEDGPTTGANGSTHLASPLVFYDYDLGYLLLTFRSSQPYAAILDAPETSFPSVAELRRLDATSQVPGSPILPPRRLPYQVPAIFYSASPLELFVDKQVPHRQRHTLKEQVRLSPATLDLVAAAHRMLSAHTNVLERAASDLFRRCERLQGEMRDQLKQLTDVAERIRGVSSEIGEDGQRKEGSRSGEALDKRLQAAKDRQEQLVQRYERLRSKLYKSGGRPLSEKEKAWVAEVDTLSVSFAEGKEKEEGRERGPDLSYRLEMVKSIAEEMLAEAKTIASRASVSPEPSSPAASGAQPKVPQRLQRAKIADAMKMVERESAVIDAITSRLERLNTCL
ncbi:hypothetical protein ASPZODRAFT_57173 [Penicilliopsis zonata CBS 506.65]|uniref:Nuclear pore complex protein An-Nup82 n=1 Tax=Penicilliopsis zonata CBS 506.65 TaxID=1073090 RepID=A0A1L9STJ5_9EURO|nr:hypothetical protein ASPZODRAFT_57173 [Penicilliopsis zonata CBS 506.65]OJJ50532.1 hypothetical protein ASPZODRAFT_57173 [Penicilliopsis zonata CBS 506.65]